MQIKGLLTAIVTPFTEGRIDEEAFANLIEEQIAEGVDGIVVAGTTGESPTLSHDEHVAIIEMCVKMVNGRVPVVAGTGSNATSEAISLSKRAATAGADATLLVNPYYNKPSQEGLFRHFQAIAEAVDIPHILYNIPGRTSGKIELATMARLGEIDNIIGVKDAVGDLTETTALIEWLGPDFLILSGDDGLTLPMMAVGGHGAISVLSNIMPRQVADMIHLAADGDFAAARKIHLATRRLVEALFIETSPVPVKTALALMGKVTEEIRLPLCEMSKINREKLASELKRGGLIAREVKV